MTDMKAGRAVWHDLMSPDADASVRFYGALVGWKTRRVDFGAAGFYIYISVEDRDIGGIVPYRAGDGLLPHWYPYVLVADVDAAAARAIANGGSLRVPARDIKGTGRFALFLDPNGAEIAAMSLADPKEERIAPRPAGEFGWEELSTPDANAGTAFYESAFGWTTEPGAAHRMKRSDGTLVAETSAPREGAAGAEWFSFIAVTDIDERTAHAATLGATILRPPTDVEGAGRLSLLVDPQGARIGLIQDAPR